MLHLVEFLGTRLFTRAALLGQQKTSLLFIFHAQAGEVSDTGVQTCGNSLHN